MGEEVYGVVVRLGEVGGKVRLESVQYLLGKVTVAARNFSKLLQLMKKKSKITFPSWIKVLTAICDDILGGFRGPPRATQKRREKLGRLRRWRVSMCLL